ncbi:MAG TPA: carboxymuconolactone decarboxylase family protein [Candidatus Acidoferrales bacterium]|nr:carboxymuconolactone decarboxylase family protein [Candidatus Acidoferrales bacterium]
MDGILMARVSLIDEKDHPELAELIAKIKGARGGRLLNIYRMMLHSPELANAWFALNSAVRYSTELSGRERELAVMRVAILNRADYIFETHAKSYALDEGLTPLEIEALFDWSASNLFTSKQRALLAYADAMTRDIEVPEEVFTGLRAHYSERQIVELTMLIGAYNMHTRVLQALKIDPEPAPARHR